MGSTLERASVGECDEQPENASAPMESEGSRSATSRRINRVHAYEGKRGSEIVALK